MSKPTTFHHRPGDPRSLEALRSWYDEADWRRDVAQWCRRGLYRGVRLHPSPEEPGTVRAAACRLERYHPDDPAVIAADEGETHDALIGFIDRQAARLLRV